MLKPGLQVSLALFGFLVLPALLNLMKLASSYALGVVAVSAMIVLLELSSRHCTIRRGALVWLYVGLMAVMLHLIFVTGSSNFWAARSLVSLVFLLLVVLAVSFTAGHAARLPPERFHRIVRHAVVFLLLVGTINSVLRDILLGLTSWRAVMAPYSEPSHYSIALAPFALYAVAMRDWKLTLGFFVTLGIVLSQMGSVTILVVALLVLSVMVPIWVTVIALPALGLVITFALTSEYYLSRLAFWEGENLTALVYLQGMQTIAESLSGSNLTGLGFQQLGSKDLGLEASKLIRAIRDGQDSNILDGGFVAAKMIGEFGLLALPVAVALLFFIVRSLIKLRWHRSGKHPLEPIQVFAHVCIYGYLVEFAFRGIGYFSVGNVLLLMAPFLLTARRGSPVRALASAVSDMAARRPLARSGRRA